MARKRIFSPEFDTDPDLGSLSIPERYLFGGCIRQADDDGRFEASASLLRRHGVEW